MFEFKGFNLIKGQEIDLKIEEKVPADEEKGFVPAYKYDMVLHGTSTKVGFIDIRIGYCEGLYYGGHIGYTVLEPYRGNSYSVKACNLIKQVAEAHDMDKLYITCNPDNDPSKRTCEKLGLVLKEIIDLPPHNDMYQQGEKQKCIYEWVL
ncbi:GNAT family N-acetyltransferase [Haloplasma contractile]|uniref:Tagatose 16-diphosphate aldolase protein n=1 Tax=Haloplasma contractile SSD-17B TaxID=1033810 RepID=F7PUE7_9MOLU|nr:GNAT family N-acetyltransferase [Haloplasma contractile]ERJ11780.1 tagatose 16-diphosphate aldolase protein [Haloplasma contractile SSD-17B]